MKIITNYTFKGGVGKTVTAISHAEGLAQRGNKVLLIDVDPQANLTSYFLGEYDGKTLIDCIFEPELTKQTVINTNTDNIDIIAGDMRLIVTNDELTIAKGLKHLKLTKVLDEVNNDYDYCIIDCPPYFTELVVNALFATDIVVIPFRGDRNSLFAFDTVVKTVKDFNKEYSTNIKYKGLFTGKQINNNCSSKLKLLHLG